MAFAFASMLPSSSFYGDYNSENVRGDGGIYKRESGGFNTRESEAEAKFISQQHHQIESLQKQDEQFQQRL